MQTSDKGGGVLGKGPAGRRAPRETCGEASEVE